MAVPKLPVPVPNSTETLLLFKFATAKSDLPSPLKSPTVTEKGRLPTEKSVAVPKLPVPVPNSTETVLLKSFATAKSDLPSPLKSPTVTERGLIPTEKLVAGPKLPVPVPNSTETLLLSEFATAKSDLPSPLKSPTVTELGRFPTVKLVGGLKAISTLIACPSTVIVAASFSSRIAAICSSVSTSPRTNAENNCPSSPGVSLLLICASIKCPISSNNTALRVVASPESIRV